jgi:hypothetical protein
MRRRRLVAIIGIAGISVSIGLASEAQAAPHHHAAAAKLPAGTSSYRVQQVFQVPHSSQVFALMVKGGQDNATWRIVRKSGSHWVKVKVPKLGGRYGSLSSFGAANSKTLYLSGAYQSDGINEVPALWHWNGGSFTRVKLPPTTSGAESAGQISFSSPTNAWVSGGIWDAADNQAALHLVGKTWTLVEHPVDSTVDEGFISIATVSPNLAWAVNGDSTVDYWNGTAWNVGPAVPAGMQPFGVAADKQAAYIVGAPPYPTTAKPMIAKWVGTAWVLRKLPKVPHNTGLSSIAISGKSVWAMGEHEPGNYIYQPVVLHSTGGKWKSQNVNGGKRISDGSLTVASSKSAWFGGQYTDPQNQVFKSFIAHYTGGKWKPISSKI